MTQHPANRCRWTGILCSLLIVLCAASAMAQAVAVVPSRIVLDGRARSATAFISNRSDQAETYRVSLSYWRMAETGALVRADSLADSTPDFAGRVLRYSPRRMVIPAGGSQTLRILVRRPPDLQDRDMELRAHLAVRSVPTVPRLQEVSGELQTDREDVIVARTWASVETLVPVIVRLGRPQAEIALEKASITEATADAGQALEFVIDRRGDRSVYGDLVVDHVGADGERVNLHTARGVAIYANLDRRRFRVDLGRLDGSDLLGGRITIDYQETSDGGGDLELHRVLDLGALAGR